MSKSKKILLLMFTITLVINLQLTGTLTSGMDNGFSLEQLADNIFVPSAYAGEGIYGDYYRWELACSINGRMGTRISCGYGGNLACVETACIPN